MVWAAVDYDESEYIYNTKPYRLGTYWYSSVPDDNSIELKYMQLPKGSIKKLIGKELTWSDEPIELIESSE